MNTQDFNWDDLSPEKQKELIDQANKKAAELKEKEKLSKLEFKELSQEFVNMHIDKCVNARGLLERISDELFNDYQTILDTKIKAYGVKVKNNQSHTSTLPDGSASITIGWNTQIIFDGTESAGIAIIKDFISSLAGDDKRIAILNNFLDVFLKKNKTTGQLNPSKIIELNKKRAEINSEEFNRGLDIIIDAQMTVRTSMFVSGWKTIEKDGKPKKIEFRFSI